MTDKIRLWAVRRWLRKLPTSELQQELIWRESARMINEAWDKAILTMYPFPKLKKGESSK